jgi:hypothetical protein
VKTILDTFSRCAVRANCPFRKERAIDLAPARLAGIVSDLLSDDWSAFYCRKTVHNDRSGAEWDENGTHEASGAREHVRRRDDLP